MKNNDRKILETLITKYGRSNVNLAVNRLNENTELKKNIQEFFKANDSQFEKFRKDLFKYGFGMVSSFFYTGENEVKLIFESKFIDNYFAHQPNEYKVTVCVGSMKSPDVEILRVQTRNGLTKQVLYDAIEKFLIEEFSEMNKSSKTNIVNEAVYEYDYNRLSDCPLTYNTQLDFKKYFIKRSTQEDYKFNKNIFYFDDIDCVDTKTSRDIPGVKANKTLNFDEAYNRLLKYFLNDLQEQVNESDDSSMYDAYRKNDMVKAINEMEERLEPITIYIDYVVDDSMQLRKDKICFRKNGIKAECEIEEQFDNMELTAISEKSKYALTDWMLNYYLDDADLIEEYWPELLPYVDDCEGAFVNYNNCF